MIRIAGVNIPENKLFPFALSIIKGIGPTEARKIANHFKIAYTTKIGDLDEDLLSTIRNYITTNYITEGDAVRAVRANISRLINIGCWKGKRHKAGLPVRGQSTKNNNRTVRGNKRITAGSGKAKAASKT